MRSGPARRCRWPSTKWSTPASEYSHARFTAVSSGWRFIPSWWRSAVRKRSSSALGSPSGSRGPRPSVRGSASYSNCCCAGGANTDLAVRGEPRMCASRPDEVTAGFAGARHEGHAATATRGRPHGLTGVADRCYVGAQAAATTGVSIRVGKHSRSHSNSPVGKRSQLFATFPETATVRPIPPWSPRQ
jgi:hypothetical protein